MSAIPATAFTPVEAATGGAVMGVASVLLMLFCGRITGLSGIADGAISLKTDAAAQSERAWKAVYFGAMLLTLAGMNRVRPDLFDTQGLQAALPAIVAGGFFVGLGSRLGCGCTSGHGICGLARFSKRSFAAVLTFMTMGVATTTVLVQSGWPYYITTGASDTATVDWWDQQHASIEIATVAAGVTMLLLGFMSQHAGLLKQVATALCSALFSVGLALSGMTQYPKVLNFLWIGPQWDPSLMFVMGSAAPVAALGFYMVFRMDRPVIGRTAGPGGKGKGKGGADECKFCLPTKTDLDFNLLVGAWMFGMGWGLAGVCPGPSFARAAAGDPKFALLFLPAFAVGMFLVPYVRIAERRAPHPSKRYGG